MTNDKQVEVLRDEFEIAAADELFNFHKDDNSNYTSQRTSSRFEGFVIAKRSMQTIDLPLSYWDEDGNFVYSAEEAHSAITAAGYSYRVIE